MTGQFLFSCNHCGEPFQISEQQAGMSLDCPRCEISNRLPGLRDIRLLPPSNSNASQKIPVRNESRSLLFAAGLLVAVVAAIMAVALGKYAQGLIKESTARQELEIQLKQIEKMSAGQLWDVWDAWTTQGLPDWQETSEVRYRKQAGYLTYISYFLYGLSALGVLGLLASLFPIRTAAKNRL